MHWSPVAALQRMVGMGTSYERKGVLRMVLMEGLEGIEEVKVVEIGGVVGVGVDVLKGKILSKLAEFWSELMWFFGLRIWEIRFWRGGGRRDIYVPIRKSPTCSFQRTSACERTRTGTGIERFYSHPTTHNRRLCQYGCGR